MRGLQLFKNEIYYTRERLEKAAARAGRASGSRAAHKNIRAAKKYFYIQGIGGMNNVTMHCAGSSRIFY